MLKRVIAIILTIVVFSGEMKYLGFVYAKETLVYSGSEQELVDDLLRKYATTYTYLGDSEQKYVGYVEWRKGEWLKYSCKDTVPISPISYRIDDFDLDGQDELLIVTMSDDYWTILEIYEVEKGSVVKKDSVSFESVEGQIKSGLQFEEGSFNCLTYSWDGKKIIALEEYSFAFVSADGVGFEYVTVEYQDGKFRIIGNVGFAGSAWDESTEKRLADKLENMGVSVNISDVLNRKSHISDYMEQKIVFASVKNQPRSYDYEYYKDVTDKKDCSDITFVKQNTEGSGTIDPSPKPPEGIEENAIVYFDDSLGGKRTSWIFDYTIDDCLKGNATEYNPNLAHMLAALAKSAYQKEGSVFTLLKDNNGVFPDDPLAITESLRNLGFKIENKDPDVREFNYYSSSEDSSYGNDTTAFTLAVKNMSDGTKLVSIVVRGSYGDIKKFTSDWQSNVNFKNMGVGFHEGFESAAYEIMEELKKFKNDKSIGDDKVKYVVTGHSRGAAVANLVSKKLIDSGISKSKVFNYNFACPDSARDYSSQWNPNGKYDSLYNVNNVRDIVGVIPGNLFNSSLNINNFYFSNELGVIFWGKYGHTFFFAENWDTVQETMIGGFEQHAAELYLKNMAKRQSTGSFKSWEQARATLAVNAAKETFVKNGKVFGVFSIPKSRSNTKCAVDIEVIDENGMRVAEVVNGQPQYYTESFGEIVIVTAGDQSLIYVNGNKEYYVKLVGNDVGKMTYCVSDAVLGDEYGKEIEYTNIPVSPGETMISRLANHTASDTVTLVLLDEEFNPEKQIDYNGKEQELSDKLKEEYSNLPIGKNEEQYKITYRLDGGQVTGNPVTYNKNTDTFTLMNPVKSGYIFIGWTGANGNNPETTVTVNKGTIGDLLYIANWMEEGIKDAIDIAKATMTLSQEGYIYDGRAKMPTVTVKLNEKTLSLNSDYTVSYSNNINVGTATVTVTGIGSYTGTVTKNFTITSNGENIGGDTSKISITEAVITLSQNYYSYDGWQKRPFVTVKLNGKTLKVSEDYLLIYHNNIDVGTAQVIIIGKGKYTGYKSIDYTIAESEKQSNFPIISCKKKIYKTAYGAKSFTINATSKSKLLFTSCKPEIVSVDKNTGQVTVKGTGIAGITIKARRKAVSVLVKVSPKEASLKSVRASNGRRLTVKWAKDNMATGYQVQLSTAKNFKKSLKKKNLSGTSYTFTKLKAGKKYYVRVRSYKKCGMETLYGTWSKVKQSNKIKN